MLSRIVCLFKSITKVLVAQDNLEHIRKNVFESDITKIQDLLVVLEPFFLITEKLSTAKFPSISMILPATHQLYKLVIKLKNYLN